MCGCLSCTPYWRPGLQPFGSRPAFSPLSHTSQGEHLLFYCTPPCSIQSLSFSLGLGIHMPEALPGWSSCTHVLPFIIFHGGGPSI